MAEKGSMGMTNLGVDMLRKEKKGLQSSIPAKQLDTCMALTIQEFCRTDYYRSIMRSAYQNDKSHGPCKTPDQFVVDGNPAEIWVPIAFWIQTN